MKYCLVGCSLSKSCLPASQSAISEVQIPYEHTALHRTVLYYPPTAYVCLSTCAYAPIMLRCTPHVRVGVQCCIVSSVNPLVIQLDRWTTRPREYSYCTINPNLFPPFSTSPFSIPPSFLPPLFPLLHSSFLLFLLLSFSLSMVSPSPSLLPLLSLWEGRCQLDWHHSWSRGASMRTMWRWCDIT